MSPKAKKALIIGAGTVLIIAAIVAGRDRISSSAYSRAADGLSSSLPADLEAKYGEELKDAVDKFWNCYKKGICSRNDMTDVMDYMKRLTASGNITDSDIFEFLGFVTRLYTDRIDYHHRNNFREMEEDRQ